jgi:hypothetical protein
LGEVGLLPGFEVFIIFFFGNFLAERGLVKLLGFSVNQLVEQSLFFLFTIEKPRVWDFCALRTPLDDRLAIFSIPTTATGVNNDFFLLARILNRARIFFPFQTFIIIPAKGAKTLP